MLKVLSKLCVNNLKCVSVEGDISFLKNGLKLKDEKGNIFVIESIGMPHYTNPADYNTHAEIVISGDVKNMGSTLFKTE